MGMCERKWGRMRVEEGVETEQVIGRKREWAREQQLVPSGKKWGQGWRKGENSTGWRRNASVERRASKGKEWHYLFPQLPDLSMYDS